MNLETKSISFLFFFLLILSLILSFIPIEINTENSDKNFPKIKNSFSWDDFIVESNSDWENLVNQGICYGNGTEEFPYVLENYVINETFIIRHTNKYFLIQNCIINNIDLIYGDDIYETDNGKFINNTFTYSFSISCANSIIFTNNTILDRIWLYYGSSNLNFTKNNFYGWNSGLYCQSTINNLKILYNFFSNCQIAIFFGGNILNSEVIGNEINGGGHPDYQRYGQIGILTYSPNNNVIADNIIRNSNSNGIFCNCPNVNVINNTISNCTGNGIYMYDTTHSVIRNNKIHSNDKYGIWLYDDCNRNNFSGNEIYNNQIAGISFSGSNNNILFNNYIFNNTNNIGNPGYTHNDFNNSEIGNYWGDYQGQDLDDNGIGDSPYYTIGIFGDNWDYLPIWRDGPTITIKAPYGGKIFNNNTNPPKLEIECNDPALDELWYEIDSLGSHFPLPQNEKINQSIWESLDDGEIAIRFYGNDSEGNLNTKDLTIIKDTSAPIINFEFTNSYINNTQPQYFDETINFKCIVNDTTILKYLYFCENTTGTFQNRSMLNIDNNSWEIELNIHNLNWDDLFSFYFCAKDSANWTTIKLNNSGYYSMKIIDLISPETELVFISMSENIIDQVNRSTTFTFLSDDFNGSGTDKTMYKINNSEWIRYENEFNLSGLDYGFYKIYYYSIDKACNGEDISVSTFVLIDTEKGLNQIQGFNLYIFLSTSLTIFLVAFLFSWKKKIKKYH